ncbi:hypothetical protein V2J09_018423 [Rumex salicifolius]
MENIVARALKSSSFFSEAATKPVNSQALGLGEDYLIISPAAVDDFSVDEFFDLKGLSEEEGEEEEEEKSSSSSSSCVSSQDQVDEGSSFPNGLSGTGLSGSHPAADGLTIPVDDMKELELWSHLMDDTHCDDVFACPARNAYVKTGPNVEKRVRFEPEIKPATVEAARFPPPITGKPRTKRFRTTATGAWPTCSLLKPGSDEGRTKKPRVKKPKRKPAAIDDGGSIIGPVQQRRCTHCQVQKTPQWRTGPFGPKTLCNACGVRFKSGRLFPEYRPACSPTFTSEIHSNSHRKVIEMRKKKMTEPAEPDFTPTILSC